MNGQLAKISILMMVGFMPAVCHAFSVGDQALSGGIATNDPRHEISVSGTQLPTGTLKSGRSMEESANLIRDWLHGYNYAVVWESGKVKRILVGGQNDSGVALNELSHKRVEDGFELISYQPSSKTVPEVFKGALPGSVRPVEIPVSRLLGMKLGDAISLKVPTGEFRVVHDNRYSHENGDVTWVGYIDEVGKGFRVILTTGSEGTFGQVVSPGGAYDIVFEEGGSWLVDLGAMGFLAGGSEQDGQDHDLVGQLNLPQQSERSMDQVASAKVSGAKSKASSQIAARMREGAYPIDILVLYPKGVSKSKLDSRVNYLVDKANQAYIDSSVNMVLRVVGREVVKYGVATANADALNELSGGLGAFAKVPRLRSKYGADLVSLIRPFRYAPQKNCGIAWVNGANGTALLSSLGYSVVSDGFDPSGWYCSDFTFAHELGHNMGSVHDREHSTFSGVFPFSYGYGQAGKFGTIMSYFDPVLGLFSSPRETCVDQACGQDEYADNVRSLNAVAPTVANFEATRK